MIAELVHWRVVIFLVIWRVARPSAVFFSRSGTWVPHPCVFCKGGYDAACTNGFVMPIGLHRTYGVHHLHFITSSSYKRLPFPRSVRSRDTCLRFWKRLASVIVSSSSGTKISFNNRVA